MYRPTDSELLCRLRSVSARWSGLIHAIDLYVYDFDCEIEHRAFSRERCTPHSFGNRSDLDLGFVDHPCLTSRSSSSDLLDGPQHDLAIDRSNRSVFVYVQFGEISQSVTSRPSRPRLLTSCVKPFEPPTSCANFEYGPFCCPQLRLDEAGARPRGPSTRSDCAGLGSEHLAVLVGSLAGRSATRGSTVDSSTVCCCEMSGRSPVSVLLGDQQVLTVIDLDPSPS